MIRKQPDRTRGSVGSQTRIELIGIELCALKDFLSLREMLKRSHPLRTPSIFLKGRVTEDCPFYELDAEAGSISFLHSV